MDNYFSGDDILKYIVERGWKATMMCRHDRLPKDVPGHHFHNLKGKAVDLRSKVAHFEQPIIAVKRVPGNQTCKEYIMTHISFQLIGGTNMSSVNALSKVGPYVRECNKGRGDQKRQWGIKMNEARKTYLKGGDICMRGHLITIFFLVTNLSLPPVQLRLRGFLN